MPVVAFYILQEQTQAKRLAFACELIEKAYQDGQRVYVHTPNQAIAHEIDESLWTYHDTSFIPHGLLSEAATPPPPVQIGFGDLPNSGYHLLINLSDEMPATYQRYANIAEIIANEPTQQALGRERYRTYRAQACDITTHKL